MELTKNRSICLGYVHSPSHHHQFTSDIGKDIDDDDDGKKTGK